MEIKPQYTPVSQVIHVETPRVFRLSFLNGTDAKSIKSILEMLDRT